MEPDVMNLWRAPSWDTEAYWAKREAREKLQLAKLRARKDRPRRAKRFKIAKASRRRNRAA